jgi:tetratricopeptide (TPR) repeat protein
MKRNLFIFTFILISFFTYSGNEVDSLFYELSGDNSKKDLNTCLTLVEAYNKTSKHDSLIQFAELAVKLAKKHKEPSSLMKALFYQAQGYYDIDHTKKSKLILGNLKKLATTQNSSVYIIKHHVLLAFNFQKEANYARAIYWFEKGYSDALNFINNGDQDRRLFYNCKLSLRQLAYSYVYSSRNYDGEQWYLNAISKFKPTIPDEIKRAFYSDLSYIYSQGIDHNKAIELARKAVDIAHKGIEQEDLFQDYCYLGIAYRNEDIEKSTQYYLKCLEYVDEYDPKSAWIYDAISRNFNVKGDFKKSVEYQFKGSKIHQVNNDSLGLTFGYISLGENMLNWRSYEDAEKYLLIAAKYFKTKKLYLKLSEAATRLYSLYIKQDLVDKAKEYVDLLKENMTLSKVPRASGLYFVTYAHYLVHVEKRYDVALNYAQKALDYFLIAKDLKYITISYSILGKSYKQKNKYEQALKYFFKTIEHINKFTQIFLKEEILTNMVEIFEKIGEKDKAYKYMKELSTVEKTIFERDNKLTMFKKERDYELQIAKKKFNSLKNSNQKLDKSVNNYKFLLVLSIILLFLIFALFNFFNSFRHKNLVKKKDSENKKMVEQLEQTNTKVKQVSKELQEKEASLNKLKSDFGSVVQQDAKKSDFFSELNNVINAGIFTEEQWVEFYVAFNKIFPGFVLELNERFPNLTKNDVKILSLVKLNFSTMEISNILMVSYSSLMTARYRLRKKINMSKDERIEDLVKSLGE